MSQSQTHTEARGRARAPAAPIVLVCTKTDLRDAGKAEVSHAEGEALRRRIDATAYVECSALTQHGLKAVFDTVVDAHLRPELFGKKAQGGCCVIQ